MARIGGHIGISASGSDERRAERAFTILAPRFRRCGGGARADDRGRGPALCGAVPESGAAGGAVKLRGAGSGYPVAATGRIAGLETTLAARMAA